MPLKNIFHSVLKYNCFPKKPDMGVFSVNCASNQVSHVFFLPRIYYDSRCSYLHVMNQCSSVFTHVFFLRISIFKMAMPVFTQKSLKPEYTRNYNDHVRVQTTIVIIIIITFIITNIIAVIF